MAEVAMVAGTAVAGAVDLAEVEATGVAGASAVVAEVAGASAAVEAAAQA
jgi:hypothetical protein